MKNIIIWGVSNYNWLWLPLAKRLKDCWGARIHFLCSNPQNVEYWKKCDSLKAVDEFTALHHFFFEYDSVSGSKKEIYEQARFYEEKYGTLVVDVLQTDRHLGRGFSAGGMPYLSELSKKSDYIKSISIFNKLIGFWEDYFSRTKADLIIGGASGIIGKTCAVVARARKIPTRILASSRYAAYFYWAHDEYYSFPELEQTYNSIINVDRFIGKNEIKSIKRLPWTHKNYGVYFRYKSRFVLLKCIIQQLRIFIYRKTHKVISMGNYCVIDKIRSLCQTHKEMRAVNRLKTISLQELENLDYVFYPLHVEPETALNVLSPEFNEQLALIELIAKSLPAGILLVIKEHLAAVGRRPRDFYSTILAIPNVKMLSPLDYALDAARMARCVAVITSTLGTEAAILGIPVISFGIHNNFNFLSHAHVVESWKELKPLLKHLCLYQETEEMVRKRQEDGIRFLAALKASSVDLGSYDYSSKNREQGKGKEVEVLYVALMKSIGAHESVAENRINL